MNKQAELRNRVRMYDFVLFDTRLYLDSHPNNEAALAYFEKMQQAHNKALAEYETAYGPLAADRADTSAGHWNWIDDPWPWEGADN